MSNISNFTNESSEDREYIYQELLLRKRLDLKRKIKLEKEKLDKEIEKEEKIFNQKNKLRRNIFSRKKESLLNNISEENNINRPKVNLASQVKKESSYRYDGAAMAYDDDVYGMPDLANEAMAEEFRRWKKKTVKAAVKKAQQGREARRAQKAYKTVKATGDVVRTAKGIKGLGLFIKSLLTLASLESFGISLLINFLLLLLQFALYVLPTGKTIKAIMKPEWYDWVFLAVVVVLMVLIIGLVLVVIAGSLGIGVELGFKIAGLVD